MLKDSFYCGIAFADGSPEFKVEDLQKNIFNFPVAPSSFEMAMRYLTSITPTINGVVVDRYGNAPSPISLAGTFGFKSSLNSTIVKSAGETTLNGTEVQDIPVDVSIVRYAELFNKLGLLSLYLNNEIPSGWKMTQLLQAIVERSNKPVPGIIIHLYVYPLGKRYEVVLNSLSISSDVSSNFLWYYSLFATILREVPYDTTKINYYTIGEEITGSKSSTDLPKNFARRQLDRASGMLRGARNRLKRLPGVGSISQKVKKWNNLVGTLRENTNTFRGAVYDFRQMLRQNPITNAERLLGLPRGTLTDTIALAYEFNDLARGISQASGEARNLVKSVFGIKDQAIDILKRVDDTRRRLTAPTISDVAAISSIIPNAQLTPTRVGSLPTQSETATELLAVLSGIEQDTNDLLARLKADNGVDPFSGDVTGARHTIIQGDTLRRIAQDHYDDPELMWDTIKQYNTTVIPSRLASSDPLDSYAGKILLIPFSNKVARSSFVRAPSTVVTLLGSDIDKDFSIVRNDYQTVKGSGQVTVDTNGLATFTVSQKNFKPSYTRIKIGASYYTVTSKTSDILFNITPVPEALITATPFEICTDDILLIEPPEDGINDTRWTDYVTDIMSQSIQQALSVPQGALDDIPEYGTRLSAVVGEVFRGDALNQMLEMSASQSIAQDNRIASISTVRATLNQGVVQFDVQFKLIGEEENSPVYRLISNTPL